MIFPSISPSISPSSYVYRTVHVLERLQVSKMQDPRGQPTAAPDIFTRRCEKLLDVGRLVLRD